MRRRLSPAIVLAIAIGLAGAAPAGAARSVPDALRHAGRLAGPPTARQITVTLTLRRRDQRGFDRFLAAVRDPRSSRYRHFAGQRALARRYGPRRSTYRSTLRLLRRRGLRVVRGSANRMTITATGPSAAVGRAFGVRFADYLVGGRRITAAAREPVLPRGVQAVSGLSDVDRPQPLVKIANWEAEHEQEAAVEGGTLAYTCLMAKNLDEGLEPFKNAFEGLNKSGIALEGSAASLDIAVTVYKNYFNYRCAADELNLVAAYAGSLTPARGGSRRAPDTGNIGAGQTVGLVEFAGFLKSDVEDQLALMGIDPARATTHLAVHPVAGGAGPAGGPGEPEALLDVGAVLSLAPGAQVAVYDTAFSGGASFEAMFNAMIDDGVDVISNSWSECEDQASLAHVQAIDQILAGAAASGISVLNAAGDSGSGCLDGSPGTVGVPADSPHATAVGGTSSRLGILGTYGSERWWDGLAGVQPTGQGGFGVSRYFARPAYQAGQTGAARRSVPDIVANADPARGYVICQASDGGCPNGKLYGGTSVTAPILAAFVADMSSRLGHDIGELNPAIYPHAGTRAFHDAASLNSDFAHVGLGSPNVDALFLALDGGTVGPVSGTDSRLYGMPVDRVVADGTTKDAFVAVALDGKGHPVPGKHVALAADAGSHAVITPAAGAVTSPDNGAAIFHVSDTVPETVTLTATDTDDGVAFAPTTVEFITRPAAAAGVVAAPATVIADNLSTAKITVTLQDAAGQPATDKQVQLTPSDGTHSLIAGPSPPVTDADGRTTFTVRDAVAEVVTYRATDVTDGNLEIPQTATVTFTDTPQNQPDCFPNGTPAAAAGYGLADFAVGLPFSTTDGVCIGPLGIAFDSQSRLYAVDQTTQELYRFGAEGGVADGSTKLGDLDSAPYGLINGIAFGKDGRLYAAAGGFFEGQGGAIVELDPETGVILRALATYTNFGSTDCAAGIATDPLSGDLFFTMPRCTFLGGEPLVNRISNPASDSPVLSTYANVGQPADGISFAPDGTIFVALPGTVKSITGTGGPAVPVVSTVATLNNAQGQPATLDGIAVGTAAGSSTAAFLIVNRNDGIVTRFDLTAAPAVATDIFTGGSRGDFVEVGPDGCFYATQTDRVIKLIQSDGTCSLSETSAAPQLGLSPVTADPVQGEDVTVTATLHNVADPAGVPIAFVVDGANRKSGAGVTGADGKATFTFSGNHDGADTVVASARQPDGFLRSNQATVTWSAGPHPTFLSLNRSPAGGAVGSSAELTATLVDLDAVPATPVGGAALTLGIGVLTCQATTDPAGRAACAVTPAGPAGMLELTGSFAGTAGLRASDASQAFLLTTPRSTRLTYVGDGSVTRGSPLSLAARLELVDGGALVGRAVTITLGSGVTAQACSAATGADGVARCSIATVDQPAGAAAVRAVFAGDDGLGATTADATVDVVPVPPVEPVPSPAATATPAPTAAPTPAPAPSRQPASVCGNVTVTLLDVFDRAGRAQLLGYANPSLAGQTATIVSTWDGKRVGTTTVGADGYFRATAALPPRRLRTSNRARYRADAAGFRSAAVKFSRRMYVFGVSSAAAGKVRITGRVVGPLARPAAGISVTRRTSCREAAYAKVAATVRLNRRSGAFTVTVAAPPADAPGTVFRLITRVRGSAASSRTFTTNSLPRVVG